MRVFIGFGYNNRDRWIEELVFPIVRGFGHETVTGKDLVGQPIHAGVAERITNSHALIGFLTRRDPMVSGGWTTHRWVVDELGFALGKSLRVIEVRETEVDDQGGLLGDRQRLVYDEARRDQFLADLVGALSGLPKGTVRLQLLGENLQRLVPLRNRAGFRCEYRFNVDGVETAPTPAALMPITGGLFVDVLSPPPRALVQVEIEYQNTSWVSVFESLDSHNVTLIEG